MTNTTNTEKVRTTSSFKFSGSKETIEIVSNENGPITLVANPKSKLEAHIGSQNDLDLKLQMQYLTAIGDHFRFDAYGHPLNALVEDGRLQLKPTAPITKVKGQWIVDEFGADMEIGHVAVGYNPVPLQQQCGIYIPAPTIEKFPFGWALVGIQEGRFFLGQAKSQLVQSRKLLAVRAIKAGRKVSVYVAVHRNFLETLMESWIEPDDDVARQIRSDAIAAGQEKKAIRRQAYRALNGGKNETVEVQNGALVDTAGDTPQVVVASLIMRKKGGGEVDLATLAAGQYTIMDQHARHIVANGQAWDPSAISPYAAKIWEAYIDRKCVIELR